MVGWCRSGAVWSGVGQVVCGVVRTTSQRQGVPGGRKVYNTSRQGVCVSSAREWAVADGIESEVHRAHLHAVQVGHHHQLALSGGTPLADHLDVAGPGAGGVEG